MFSCSHHARHTPCLSSLVITALPAALLPTAASAVFRTAAATAAAASNELGPCLRELDLLMLRGAGCCKTWGAGKKAAAVEWVAAQRAAARGGDRA
eukprot:scaffold167220_cov19-Tisochrysis_lutea.AAC.1